MAITSVEYALIRRLRELGLVKPGGRLIEFGEANWYGDVTLDTLRADIAAAVDRLDRARLLQFPADHVLRASPPPTATCCIPFVMQP